MVELRDRYTEVADAMAEIRQVRAQVRVRRAALPEGSRAEADGILEQLRDIEGVLTKWMGSEAHPMMWSPPGLTEKLSTLSSAIGGSEARPMAQMYALLEDFTERLEVQRARFDQLVEGEVGPLLSR